MAILATTALAALPVSAEEPRCIETPGLEYKMCTDGFLGYWEAHGGLSVFGYPMSDLTWDESAGRSFQWTERQRFEAWPENQPPYHVLLGLLGVEDAKARGYMSRAEFQKSTQRNDALMWFPETGHNITRELFAEYWENHGLSFDYVDGVVFEESLALFGYPISEEFTDPETGLITQYFQRAVFEYHPGNSPEWQVLLRRVGADAVARQIAPTPANPSCDSTILSGDVVQVPAGCLIIGDVEISGNQAGPFEVLYDDKQEVGLLVIVQNALWVKAPWNATVVSGNVDDYVASMKSPGGCGLPTGCMEVTIVIR